MLAELNVFRLAGALATYAGQRQAVVAQNVANSDTPGYRARDLAPFSEMMIPGKFGSGMRASRATHLNGASGAGPTWEITTPVAPADPNGNTVSIESEMLRAVEVKRQQDRALAIYKFSLNIVRTSLGR